MPPFVYQLIGQLRRRGLPLGVDDCVSLRHALASGFGLSSNDDLQRVCVALWAKSPADTDVIRAVFARIDPKAPQWTLRDTPIALEAERPPTVEVASIPRPLPAEPTITEAMPPPAPILVDGLPLIPPRTGAHEPSLLFYPQYPMTEREVAQIWRRLRRPVRHGPTAELDMPATIEQMCRTGVATGPVLVPARRNTARLVLVIDRNGSMTPRHEYVDYIVRAIEKAGRLDMLQAVYFHNVVGQSRSQQAIDGMISPFALTLDNVLHYIDPLHDGLAYDDRGLTEPRRWTSVLSSLHPSSALAIVSDAGAARGRFSTTRLLDTIAFLRSVSARTRAIAWLNPVSPMRWPHSTAEQIARHVPMFPMTGLGMRQAVDVLRGRPSFVERPV